MSRGNPPRSDGVERCAEPRALALLSVTGRAITCAKGLDRRDGRDQDDRDRRAPRKHSQFLSHFATSLQSPGAMRPQSDAVS